MNHTQGQVRKASAELGMELPGGKGLERLTADPNAIPASTKTVDSGAGDNVYHSEVEGAMPLDPVTERITHGNRPGDWRERCEVKIDTEEGWWDVWCGTYYLIPGRTPSWGRWHKPTHDGHGNFETESQARAALASAPPPPGVVEAEPLPVKPSNPAPETDLTNAEWATLVGMIRDCEGAANEELRSIYRDILRNSIDRHLAMRAYRARVWQIDNTTDGIARRLRGAQ